MSKFEMKQDYLRIPEETSYRLLIKKGSNNSTQKKFGRIYLTKVIKVNITKIVNKMTSCASWYNALKTEYISCSIPAKNAQSESEHVDQTKLNWEHSIK